MKEKKVGIKGYEMFLCIIGVIVLLGLIMAPPLLRVFVPKEEEVVTPPVVTPTTTPTTPPVEDFTVLNCKKTEMDENGYTKLTEKRIFHQATKIKKIEVTTTETYLQVNDINKEKFENSKKICESVTDAYNTIPGYKRSCSNSNTAGEVFTLQENYDLTSFVKTEIVDTDGSTIVIDSEVAYDTEFTILKQKLEETSYICE